MGDHLDASGSEVGVYLDVRKLSGFLRHRAYASKVLQHPTAVRVDAGFPQSPALELDAILDIHRRILLSEETPNARVKRFQLL